MNIVLEWLKSTPNRTFILYPVVVIVFEFLRRGILFDVQPAGIPLLLWGYLQYRLTGWFRSKRGGGGPGLHTPPDRLVTSGPYRYVRNPMYLGHLIFMTGLALTFWSVLALLILVANAAWFHVRVLHDEARMEALFGDDFRAYKRRVRRWLPGLL
ncbi:MAG: hypothetical protein RLZ98_3671 [Pseudomonadota bacterium]|jgi:protein-S-isoprenylcysteine O-methyltransferase Ste14